MFMSQNLASKFLQSQLKKCKVLGNSPIRNEWQKQMAYLKNYFTKVPENERTPAAIAYMAALDAIGADSPEIAEAIVKELKDQRTHLKLIASENFSSLPVQLAMGNLLTDKYSEGYAGPPLLCGLRKCRRHRRRGDRACQKNFWSRSRLRPAPFGRRCQSGRLLGHSGSADPIERNRNSGEKNAR